MFELKTRAGAWPSVYGMSEWKGQHPIKSEKGQINRAALQTMEHHGVSQHLTQSKGEKGDGGSEGKHSPDPCFL